MNRINNETTIDLETLLVKLVNKNPDGVRYREIVEYKNRVLKACRDKGIRVTFLGVSLNQLDDVVKNYPLLVRSYDKTYYPGVYQNPEYFDSRNPEAVNKILNDNIKKPYTKQIPTQKRL